MIPVSELPKVGRTYRIWKVVEEIVLDRYTQIQDERMRDSYYLIREWLEPLRDSGEILTAEYDYFVDNYTYYRNDLWPRLEKKHGIRRPDTKPPTIVIEDGDEFTESHLAEAWDRSRGFIFVEKSGMAADLSLLSHHGWLIVAAQGESTRTFREWAAQDSTSRPILAVTDADYYGDGIVETLEGHSNRTEHLGLWHQLEGRITPVGLTQADARALELPRERDPTKSPDEWRTELNALTVLKERMGMETPLLSYVAAKMDYLDIPLCPLPVPDPRDRVKRALKSALRQALDDVMETAVDRVLEGFDPGQMGSEGSGPYMNLRIRHGDSGTVGGDSLTEELVKAAENYHERQYWWLQSRYEESVKAEIGDEQVGQIADLLEGEQHD